MTGKPKLSDTGAPFAQAHSRRPRLVSLGLSFFLVLAASSELAFAASPAPVVLEQDGILASLEMRAKEAVLRWRFLRPSPSPLTGITGRLDARATAIKAAARAYPDGNAQTWIALLIDVSDIADPGQKEARKLLIQGIVGKAKPHDKFAYAGYADGLLPLRPPGADAAAIAAMLDGIAAPNPTARLGPALQAALNATPSDQVERRAVFVLSDGHHDDNLNAVALAENAKAKGVNVYFILSPSGRNPDLPALSTIAQTTRGYVITPDRQSSFLADPLALLDSGGVARFSLGEQRRYFWETGNTFRVGMQYGGRKLELAAPADLDSATFAETVSYILGRYPAVIFGLVLFLALCAIGFSLTMGLRLIKRIRTRGGQTMPVLAVLKDRDSGTVYAAHTATTRLGRAPTNEIVIPDATVSRVHAVLQQERDGGFSISNKSGVNGLQVNKQDVERAELSDGDLIGLGNVTLRFSRVPAPQN